MPEGTGTGTASFNFFADTVKGVGNSARKLGRSLLNLGPDDRDLSAHIPQDGGPAVMYDPTKGLDQYGNPRMMGNWTDSPAAMDAMNLLGVRGIPGVGSVADDIALAARKGLAERAARPSLDNIIAGGAGGKATANPLVRSVDDIVGSPRAGGANAASNNGVNFSLGDNLGGGGYGPPSINRAGPPAPPKDMWGPRAKGPMKQAEAVDPNFTMGGGTAPRYTGAPRPEPKALPEPGMRNHVGVGPAGNVAPPLPTMGNQVYNWVGKNPVKAMSGAAGALGLGSALGPMLDYTIDPLVGGDSYGGGEDLTPPPGEEDLTPPMDYTNAPIQGPGNASGALEVAYQTLMGQGDTRNTLEKIGSALTATAMGLRGENPGPELRAASNPAVGLSPAQLDIQRLVPELKKFELLKQLEYNAPGAEQERLLETLLQKAKAKYYGGGLSDLLGTYSAANVDPNFPVN